MKSKALLLTLAVLLASAFPFTTARSSTPPKVKVERVAQIDSSNPQLAVSPDGQSVANVVRQGSRLAVAINEKPGPTLDQISFSETFVFSPDSKRHAYVGTKSGKRHLYVDGKPVAEVPFANKEAFQFSLDGRRYALTLATHLIVDGKSSPPYQRLEHFNFSADGRHYGYVADGQAFADGKAISPPADPSKGRHGISPVQFTAKSGRFVYLRAVLMNRGAVQLFVGDKKGPKLEGTGSSVILSEQGDHTAYSVSSPYPQKARYVVDMRPEKEFIRVAAFRFNKDGTRWAYAAQAEGGYALVVNGKPVSMEYEHVRLLMFGPDQKTVFAVARHAGKEFLLVDDKEYGPFIAVGNPAQRVWDELAFSPDGKHYAFVETPDARSGLARLIVDGKPAGQAIGTKPRYLADGRLTYLVPDDRHSAQWLMVGGKRAEFSTHRGVTFSPDGKHYAYVTAQTKGYFYVVDGKKLPHPTNLHVGVPPVFSPDGKHFAYAGPTLDRKGVQIYFDGQPVGPVLQQGVVSTGARTGGNDHWFRFDAGGNLVVLVRQQGNVIDRITVTP